ncbi:MAG: hypothetical protein P857_296 [Candidatus Xenolissoclinum pacificiensis L6]|uniref:Uncharacterized protein n=1 Tax=Candidatus Xenolissoclinum pacificiensis L6 TaxID=1401685 RepID=W2UZ25_9RICK|nr:MAG: hypothetical protein P857_296 [Candidatus Xenolissoclinum pacificiensis L6]
MPVLDLTDALTKIILEWYGGQLVLIGNVLRSEIPGLSSKKFSIDD